jgi:hypothetical protein
VNSNSIHGEVYLIQHYVIKFVSDLRQVGGFLCILWFPPDLTWFVMNKLDYNFTFRANSNEITFIVNLSIKKMWSFIQISLVNKNYNFRVFVSWNNTIFVMKEFSNFNNFTAKSLKTYNAWIQLLALIKLTNWDSGSIII